MAKKESRWEGIIKEVEKQLGVLDDQGISPTLRTMHYRLVSLGVIGNTTNEYKELSKKQHALAKMVYSPLTVL